MPLDEVFGSCVAGYVFYTGEELQDLILSKASRVARAIVS